MDMEKERWRDRKTNWEREGGIKIQRSKDREWQRDKKRQIETKRKRDRLIDNKQSQRKRYLETGKQRHTHTHICV